MLRSIGGLLGLSSPLLCIGLICLGVRRSHHVDVVLLKTPGSHNADAAGDNDGLLLAARRVTVVPKVRE